ncbi:MAG TPA: T9SS type A sorting domain-containing protein, partial [Chitinophagales bacterium]|nr:T9SS type A sorting domain-containing protein [Chitinophagales bacterium]
MRKILLLAIAGLPFVAYSQTTIISENFESYTSGQLVAANSDLWTTWSGGLDAEDAVVSNAQATSGTNSIHVTGVASGGPTDLILPFPEDYTSGVYDFSLKMYITSGKGGYFNIQQSSTPGLGWMFEVYFDNAGGGYIYAGGANAATFSYTPNGWTSVLVRADLDADKGECFINSSSIHTWQWSLGADGSGATKSIGGIDIFSYGGNGATPDFFVDDVVLIKVASPAIITETFESYFSEELLAANSDLWTTWSGGLDAEDAPVSNTQAVSGINSIHVTGVASGGPTDLILPFPQDYTSGVYDFSLKMYMVSGKGGYFNIQQSSTPGLGWKCSVYFDAAGGGNVAGGGTTGALTYTPDAWTTVLIKANLTEDKGEAYINSALVHTWQWSIGENGAETVNSMGGIDIFSYGASGATPDFYVDDVLLTESFPTGITSSASEPAIFIAPNPSDGQFSVSINDLRAGNYQLELIDMMGRLIHSEKFQTTGSFMKYFDMPLAAGLYYVRLVDGINATTKKIVVN